MVLLDNFENVYYIPWTGLSSLGSTWPKCVKLLRLSWATDVYLQAPFYDEEVFIPNTTRGLRSWTAMEY